MFSICKRVCSEVVVVDPVGKPLSFPATRGCSKTAGPAEPTGPKN